MEFIRSILAGANNLNNGPTPVLIDNVTERLEIIRSSLDVTFRGLERLFSVRYPNIEDALVHEHMESFVQVNLNQNDIAHYQLNEIISFVGQFLITLPENQWLMFFSLLMAKVTTEAHHHLHLMYGVWNNNLPILSYDAFVSNLHHSSCFYTELNNSFNAPDFAINAMNSAEEVLRISRTNAMEVSI
jgi:hypothetical protein